MTIGERIKEARLSKGWRQEDLAAKINVGKTAISQYERGMISPRFGKLKEIASVLDVDVAYLMEEESESTDRKVLEKVAKRLSPENVQKTIEYMNFLLSQQK